MTDISVWPLIYNYLTMIHVVGILLCHFVWLQKNHLCLLHGFNGFHGAIYAHVFSIFVGGFYYMASNKCGYIMH